jgi:drug/metabolite transporter (DMT)-like permease
VLVVALSVLFLKERPGKYGWLGLGAGALAIVLLGTAA